MSDNKYEAVAVTRMMSQVGMDDAKVLVAIVYSRQAYAISIDARSKSPRAMFPRLPYAC